MSIGGVYAPADPDDANVAVAASRHSGVDVLTGDGLAAALSDADVLVDASATYFGASIGFESLVTGGDARLRGVRFVDWLGGH